MDLAMAMGIALFGMFTGSTLLFSTSSAADAGRRRMGWRRRVDWPAVFGPRAVCFFDFYFDFAVMRWRLR
ncbi:hypothetical protein [Burkholderia glumae]|uniref:hypothetical protein n=1 Tax=Burkholderia glumae TaxID=337 RepID=UPI0021641F13|nr:hypothetical protein [Burkholderia glumae]